MNNEESERITTSQDVISRLHDKIDELEARLEIDHSHPYDGIAARDATIKAQDERIAELEKENSYLNDACAELEAQLEAIGAGGVEPLRKPAAQAVHPENIREGAPYDNPEFEQLARDMGVWGTPQAALCAQFWLAATQPAAQGMDAGKLLAEKHTGMMVDYRGLLGQVQREIERSAPGHAEMLRQLQGHLQELGQRWYAGDTAVVDELLQLYCVEHQARADLAAQTKQGGAANG